MHTIANYFTFFTLLQHREMSACVWIKNKNNESNKKKSSLSQQSSLCILFLKPKVKCKNDSYALRAVINVVNGPKHEQLIVLSFYSHVSVCVFFCVVAVTHWMIHHHTLNSIGDVRFL